jgi:hypothetical protein
MAASLVGPSNPVTTTPPILDVCIQCAMIASETLQCDNSGNYMQPDERTVRHTGNVIFQFRCFALRCFCMDRNDRHTIAFKRRWDVEKDLVMRSRLHFEAGVFVSAMYAIDIRGGCLCECSAPNGYSFNRYAQRSSLWALQFQQTDLKLLPKEKFCLGAGSYIFHVVHSIYCLK